MSRDHSGPKHWSRSFQTAYSTPSKRPRLALTPSSSTSTPYNSSSTTPPTDIESARRAATLRLQNTWDQLHERYVRRLDEDDIIDLSTNSIVSDRGVLSGASRDFDIGGFAGADANESELSEDDLGGDEVDELDTLARKTTACPHVKLRLQHMSPLRTTAHDQDLRDFLEAERQNRVGESEGGEQDEVALCQPEGLSTVSDSEGEDDRSEDELAKWGHSETTLLPSSPSVDRASFPGPAIEPEVIDISDSGSGSGSGSESESDEEFARLLERPRKRRRSPSPSPLPPSRPPPPPPPPLTPYHPAQQQPMPFDPARAQHVRHLVEQAVQVFSSLVSATLPSYSPYPSTPYPPFPPPMPPPVYETPPHRPLLPSASSTHVGRRRHHHRLKSQSRDPKDSLSRTK